MAIVLGKPGVDGLSEAVGVLREWQYDGAPMQLHRGGLGCFWRFGVEAPAAAVRTWSRDGQLLAVGLLDEPQLLRPISDHLRLVRSGLGGRCGEGAVERQRTGAGNEG
ncbi:hypothetical protein BH24ACT8_BH24ACT8_21250 [soil metagenome]